MSLDVWVPATYLYEPTIRALRSRAPKVQWIDTETGYLEHMIARWRDGEGFINCEHDVVPTPEQITELIECEESAWCAFAEYVGGPPTLSFALFGCEFIDANEEIWDRLGWTWAKGQIHQPLWTILDSWLVGHADRAPHIHHSIRNDRPFGSLH